MLDAIGRVITFIPWLFIQIISEILRIIAGIFDFIFGIFGFILGIILFPFKAVIAIISSVILFFSPAPLAASTPPAVTTTQPAQIQTQTASISVEPEPQELDYRKATFKQIEKNTPLFFRGQITQKINNRNALIATKAPAGYWEEYIEDIVFLVDDTPLNVLEKDMVEIVGRYEGTRSYTTVLGVEKTVPRIKVESYKVIDR